MKITSKTLSTFAALAAFVSFGALPLAATTTTVTSLSALQTAIDGAKPGDTVILANGTYSASSAINVGVAGTATAPITVEAATIGGATIGGTEGFHFTSSAAYATVQGFVFTHSAGVTSIDAGATYCRFTRNVFKCSGSGANLNVMGDNSVIDYNEFGPKSVTGQMMEVEGPSGRIAQHLWVHHNYFHDFSPVNGNGQEDIRFGLSGISLTDTYSIVEYNLFLRCSGENEVISNKSSNNTYRYNTLQDCANGGQISQRHGNYNTYYGNYVINSSGIRIYGDHNQVYSNYLEGNDIGINIGNGDADVESGGALDSHDRPDYTVIVYNTLVNNTTQYEMNGRTGGLGATYTTFANNILQGGTTAVNIASSPYTNPVWAGNIIWNVGSIGNIPSSGYTSKNPLLAADANGLVYHLQSGSPAINAGTGSYPQVTVDMDGQPRDSAPDIGADEFSTAPVAAHMLTASDVGPNANTVSQVAAPSFSLASGTYTGAQSVSISTATGGATIRYTTDGSTPTETHGTVYSGTALTISTTTTLQAIAYETGFTDSSVTAATYTITMPKAAAPAFSPAAGGYDNDQSVSITTSSSGASINYTSDGTTPTETHGIAYSGPVAVNATMTLQAIAFGSSYSDSSVTIAPYTLTVAPVSITPGSGTYTSAQNVTLSTATAGATIRYTLDGSTPSETNGMVGTTVTIGSTSTLKAIAYKAGYSDSPVASATYTIIEPQCAAPAFSPAGGTYATAQNVTITDPTPGASIRYTTDGSTPSETAGTIYSGAISVSKSITLKAVAYKAGYSDSPVTTATYTIAPITLNFEAESLSYAGSGATTSVQTDKNSSGGKWVELAGNSIGDNITFTVPSIPAGTYQLKMEWKGNNTRGILQLAVDGANLGPTLDQYASGQTYPTTTFGNVTFSSAGNHTVKLTVTGKNSKSSSYQLSADKFTLTSQ